MTLSGQEGNQSASSVVYRASRHPVEAQPLEDAELVDRAKRGDVEAYGTLVRRYQELAVRVAHLITGQVAEAEDAAQEAFVKAYYALDRIQPGAPFRPWLLRIAVNEARNLRKAARRRAELMSRASGERPSPATSRSPEAAVLANEQRTEILRAVTRLNEEDRLVIAYRYFFDLSEVEMAEALGCARGTVKSRLFRALGRLRQRLRGLPLVVWPAAMPGGRSGPMPEDLAEAGDAELEQALADLAANVPYAAPPDIAGVVLERIAAGGSPLGQSSSETTTSAQQTVAFGTLGVVLAAAAVLQLTLRTALIDPAGLRAGATTEQAPPVQTRAPQKILVYGGDLSEDERHELAGLLGANEATTTDTVTAEELAAALQAAGLPVSPTDKAISSTGLACLEEDQGLTVRTQHITRIPAAAYANALLVAGVTDGSVVIAAPSTNPVTGETALVGALQAFPLCQAGKEPEPARVRLAYEQISAQAALAGEDEDLSKVSAVMLRVAQAVVTGQAKDDASIGAALDATTAAEGVRLDPAQRSELVSLLATFGSFEYAAYAKGYHIQQLGANEVKLVPAD